MIVNTVLIKISISTSSSSSSIVIIILHPNSGSDRLFIPLARRDVGDRGGLTEPRRQSSELLAANQGQVDLLLHKLCPQRPELRLRLVPQLQAGAEHSEGLEGLSPHVDLLLDHLCPHRSQLCLGLGAQLHFGCELHLGVLYPSLQVINIML